MILLPKSVIICMNEVLAIGGKRPNMRIFLYSILFFISFYLIGAGESHAGTCPGWLLKDLKRAHKISGVTTQRYKISGNFGGSPVSVIGTARKKGPRCVVNILGHTLKLQRRGYCVNFAFAVSKDNYLATWCRNRGYVTSRGIRQTATVKRLPVAMKSDSPFQN